MTGEDNEERYEAIELIVRSRTDGASWFDVISDLIAADCRGSETEPCTCGLESMGGSGGTLEQCYRHQGIADDLVTVKVSDLLEVLNWSAIEIAEMPPEIYEAATRLRKEITWWDDYLATVPDSENEEE